MKLKYLNILMLGTLALTACTSTVGNNEISDSGNLTSGQLDWPAIKDATQPEGIFPNMENLHKIGPGLTKNDLYHLIERPHFSEMNGAREWNYIMKFRQEDRSIKVCQYKILFDKNKVARNFYWLPKDCLNEKFDLSADALFPFNKGGITDIKPAGKVKLSQLAARLAKEGNKVKVHLVGYTDYLGNDNYNKELSKQRAISVGRFLISRGVAGSSIIAEGRGEADPVVTCQQQNRQQLIKCLAPNRRVTVEIKR